MPSGELPEWELLLSSAARLQKILPAAVLVGGSAAALHAKHRFSRDADHVLPDLTRHFDKTLAELESVTRTSFRNGRTGQTSRPSGRGSPNCFSNVYSSGIRLKRWRPSVSGDPLAPRPREQTTRCRARCRLP